MKPKFLSILAACAMSLAACGGGGGGSAATSGGATGGGGGPVLGSTGSSSGSLGVYTNAGATYAVVPSGASGGAAATPNAVKLIAFPKTGSMVAAPSPVTATVITTSLANVSGTTVDPANDVGAAFDYHSGTISIFKLSTATEIATYNTGAVNTMGFSGAFGVVISGMIMDPSRKWIILSTADGFDIVDYATPTAPVRVRLIPSLAKDPVNGIEMMENFAYDPASPAGFPMLIAGGGASGGYTTAPVVVVDASTGAHYTPDAATVAGLPARTDYIDSAAVDTKYHVAVLVEEFSDQQWIVDLNKLTVNTAAGTYNIPTGAAVLLTGATSLGYEVTNIAIESNNHVIMAGAGYRGTTISIAQLQDPAVGLGLVTAPVPLVGYAMPAGNDNMGNPVAWSGGLDPHGVGAYMTDATHPTMPNTSVGLWVNAAGDHIAAIDLLGVLNGAATTGYNPLATTPQDISYFLIP